MGLRRASGICASVAILGVLVAASQPDPRHERVLITQDISAYIGVSAGLFAGRASDADRKAILALEEQWLNADDAPTLDRILANDFRHPVVTGQFLTKQQHIDWTVAHPLPQTRTARFEQVDVRLFGDVAVANGIVRTEGLTPAPMRTIFTDVFVRRSGRWQAINAQENEVRADVGRGAASAQWH